MVLSRDLDLAVLETPHRVIATVVPEGELVGAGADGEAEDLMTEADPEEGHLSEKAAQRLDRCLQRLRIAGPFDTNTPSGDRASTWSAPVPAGTTSTSNPSPVRLARMSRFMPRSIATTRPCRSLRGRGCTYGPW